MCICSACGWFLVGSLQDGNSNAWIERVWKDYPVSMESVPSQYAASIYFAMSTLSTTGFGDVTARTDAEIAFATLVMFVGSTFFAYMIGTVSSIINTLDQRDTLIRKKLENLREFISCVSIFKEPSLYLYLSLYLSLSFSLYLSLSLSFVVLSISHLCFFRIGRCGSLLILRRA